MGPKARVPASYFDVDGTLVTTNLVHPTVFYLLNQGTPLRTMQKLGRALLRAPSMAIAEHVLCNQINRFIVNFMQAQGCEAMGLHSLSSVVPGNIWPSCQLICLPRSYRRTAPGSVTAAS